VFSVGSTLASPVITEVLFGPGAAQIGGVFSVGQTTRNPIFTDVFLGVKN
jgi:hypothetical protein